MMEEIQFEYVRPIESHARFIIKWRNDPTTRKMSLHSEKKRWEVFYPEFLRRFFSLPDLPCLFALYQGKRIAFLGFEPMADPQGYGRRCCEISIHVAPHFRNRGLGVRILKEVQNFLKERKYDSVFACIKKDNIASLKAFARAGFKRKQSFVKEIDDVPGKISMVLYESTLSSYLRPKKAPVFMIAEAGSNWCVGSAKQSHLMAKKLIEIAADAGADAVKFQVFRPETIYVKNAGVSRYLSKGGIKEEIFSLFSKLAMPYEMIAELASYCRKQKIEFMATPFSEQDFQAVNPYVKRHKIASYENNHPRLISLAAKTGKPLILSTGASTEEDVAWAVETFRKADGHDLTLLQCTAQYPAEPSSLCLKAISYLHKRFSLSVGLSDHSQHPYLAPIAAVAIGATVIEKHFTVNKKLSGPDHYFSLSPKELKELVFLVRSLEPMLGTEAKVIQSQEKELYHYARRAIQALCPIRKGEILKEGVNVAILRPGNQPAGLHPKCMDRVLGKRAKHPIPEGKGILLTDI